MFNMESPAHEVSTGIPMSTKGTALDHLYSSCERVESSDLNGETVNDIYDHKCVVPSLFSNISRENGDYFMSSLQNGDESQLFYNGVCSSGLPVGGNMCITFLKSSEDASDIKYEKSTASDLCRENLCAMESGDRDIDDPLDNMQFSGSDFRFIVKEPDVPNQYNEEHKKLNESISAIAKSMDIENLLPEIFQEESTKDVSALKSEHGQCTNLMLDENTSILGKDVLELEIPITSAWPNEDSFDLSCGLVTLRTEKSERGSISMGKSQNNNYVVCAANVIAQNDSGLSASLSDVKTAKKGVLEKRSSDLTAPEITDSMGECILDSNNGQRPSFTLNGNSKNVSDCNDQIPLVHISEADYDSTVLNNLFGSDGKVQIIVSTEGGKQILEFDRELASSLNIITSIEQVASENGFCAIDALNQSENSDSLPQQSSSTEISSKADLLTLVEKLSSTRDRSKCVNKWVCPVEGCGKSGDRERQLKVHMMTHESDKPYKCPKDGCNWSFTTLYRLRRHKNSHIGNKDFPCDFEDCNKSFTTVYNLNAHKKRHCWPNVLACPAAGCDLSFTSRRKLDLHLKIHDDIEAPYNCWKCRKKYYSANCIASHNRTHKHDENDFKCPFEGCGKKYDKVCRLKQHIRFHTGERPYACREQGCTWSFVSASKLTRHMRKHTGERKFVCTEPGCGKSFMRPEHLKGHAIIHTGAKPFKCTHENCTAKFTAKSSLYVHMKKHCNNEIKVIYQCPIELCAKEYNTKATLKQHLQKMHRNVPNVDGNVQTVPVVTRLSKAPTSDTEPNCNSPAPKITTRIMPKAPPKDVPSKTVPQHATPVNVGFPPSQNTGSIACENLSIDAKIKQEQDLLFSLSNGSEIELKSSKLIHENHSGSARTDYCYDYSNNFKKRWPTQNFVRLELLNNNVPSNNNNNNENPSSSQKAITTCSNDAVLAPCVFYQDLTSDQLDQEQQFLSEEAVGNVICQDGILINSFVFSELPLTSFMCDYVDNSNDSVTNMAFSGHNTVDEFSDSTLALPCLE